MCLGQTCNCLEFVKESGVMYYLLWNTCNDIRANSLGDRYSCFVGRIPELLPSTFNCFSVSCILRWETWAAITWRLSMTSLQLSHVQSLYLQMILCPVVLLSLDWFSSKIRTYPWHSEPIRDSCIEHTLDSFASSSSSLLHLYLVFLVFLFLWLFFWILVSSGTIDAPLQLQAVVVIQDQDSYQESVEVAYFENFEEPKISHWKNECDENLWSSLQFLTLNIPQNYRQMNHQKEFCRKISLVVHDTHLSINYCYYLQVVLQSNLREKSSKSFLIWQWNKIREPTKFRWMSRHNLMSDWRVIKDF